MFMHTISAQLGSTFSDIGIQQNCDPLTTMVQRKKEELAKP